MTRYTVTAYVNVDAANFLGYQPHHPIAEVDTFTVQAASPEGAAEAMFAVGNKEVGPDAEGKAYPHDVRSISVGDLLKVADGSALWFFAVASVGWTEIPEPTNPIVPLVGTRHTSRTTRTQWTPVAPGDGPVVLESGRLLTPAELDALADEAEVGYDVELLKRQPNRREP
jgi:hypothetical protein